MFLPKVASATGPLTANLAMPANSSYSQHCAIGEIGADDWIPSVIALLDLASQHLTCVPESARVTQHRYFKSACSALRKYKGIFTALTCESVAGGEGECPLWYGQIIDAILPMT